MTSITSKQDEEEANSGIADAQPYSLISAIEIQLTTFSSERLVQIRNPAGFKEWCGDWSDHSIKWKQFPQTKELIR